MQEEVEEIVREARRTGVFDEWLRRYMEVLDREGLIRDHLQHANKAVERSGILPQDTAIAIPQHRRDAKIADINAMLEKQNIVADASYRAFEMIRKNSSFREVLRKDVERINVSLNERGPSLKRSRDPDTKLEDERDTKRFRDGRL